MIRPFVYLTIYGVTSCLERYEWQDVTLKFFSDIFGSFVETDKHSGYFELKSTDAGIDLAA